MTDRKSMYYSVHHTKIFRNHYRSGNSGVLMLVKNILTVLRSGSSPISQSARKRKLH